MGRRPRVEVPGALYHLTAHATAPERLFRDRLDHQALLARLALEIGDRGWICHAYCLMDTHYHLLIETPAADLAKGIHRLNGRYAWEFNKRYRRGGHLFRSRYHASIIESDRHLLEVIRYVALNPVRAGACHEPEAWLSSSYRATAGLDKPDGILTIDWVLSHFGSEAVGAQERYRAFVAEGIERRVVQKQWVPGTAVRSL